MNENDNPNADQVIGNSAPCFECGAGMMRLDHITYFTWLHEELITVPNFPAWVCDVCGRREFDARAIAWLNTLLNPSTGRKPKMNKRSKGDLTGTDRLRP